MPLICINDEFFIKMTETVIDTTCPTYHKKPKDNWISTTEAMEKLRITSPTTLNKYKDTGKISASPLSPRHILYDASSIDEFLDNNRLEKF
jgi:hypothetical protein